MSVFMWQTLFVKYNALFVCMTRHMHLANSKLSQKIARVNGALYIKKLLYCSLNGNVTIHTYTV